MEMERKTPLYEKHVEAGGKIVSFGGYSLPVQYTGIIAEHNAVRKQAGLFDVSHMGEVIVSGKDAFDYLQKMMTNDFTSLQDGKIRYTLMCNDQGGVIDDLLVYRCHSEKYLLVVNAGNREKDVAWLNSQKFGDVQVNDISDEIGLVALQGPKAKEILLKVTTEENIPEKYYSFIDQADIQGMKCLISQTGYTGEAGYEIYCNAADIPKIWDLLLESGQELGLIPCGLGARDTLRLEAGMPLYSHEMDEEITPLEAELGFAVKMAKEDFIGKKALVEKGEPSRIRVGLKMTGRGIARENETIYVGETPIGKTTSGTHAPYLGYAIASGIIDREYSEIGTAVEIDVRGRRIAAEVIPLPFYKREQ